MSWLKFSKYNPLELNVDENVDVWKLHFFVVLKFKRIVETRVGKAMVANFQFPFTR